MLTPGCRVRVTKNGWKPPVSVIIGPSTRLRFGTTANSLSRSIFSLDPESLPLSVNNRFQDSLEVRQ